MNGKRIGQAQIGQQEISRREQRSGSGSRVGCRHLVASLSQQQHERVAKRIVILYDQNPQHGLGMFHRWLGKRQAEHKASTTSVDKSIFTDE